MYFKFVLSFTKMIQKLLLHDDEVSILFVVRGEKEYETMVAKWTCLLCGASAGIDRLRLAK